MDEETRSPVQPSANPNRARDHMANERTYLAWMRTSVALMGFGIVIVRLRYLAPSSQRHGLGWELGLVFAVVGLLMVLFATRHYFHIQHALENNCYEPERRWILACSLVVVLVGTGVLLYLFRSAPPGDIVPAVTLPATTIWQLPE
jgi:putative membrane protein